MRDRAEAAQPDPPVVSAMDAIFAAVAAGEDPAAAYQEATTTSLADLLPWLVLVLAAAGAVGGALWWRPRRPA